MWCGGGTLSPCIGPGQCMEGGGGQNKKINMLQNITGQKERKQRIVGSD